MALVVCGPGCLWLWLFVALAQWLSLWLSVVLVVCGSSCVALVVWLIWLDSGCLALGLFGSGCVVLPLIVSCGSGCVVALLVVWLWLCRFGCVVWGSGSAGCVALPALPVCGSG